MNITAVYSPASRTVREWVLDLAHGSTVGQAIEACKLYRAYPELKTQGLLLGIWGKRVALHNLLRENDRLEIYRGLRVDPKIARRERFNRQGVKASGLFSATRPGAKAGY